MSVTVKLIVPNWAFAGAEVPFSAEITSDKELRIIAVDAEIVACSGRSSNSLGSARQEVRTFERSIQLAAGQLPGGTSIHAGSFTIPGDTPSTHYIIPGGRSAWSRLDVKVQIAIRYGFDIRRETSIVVRPPPPNAPIARPPMHAEQAELALALASSHMVGGELVAGAVSVALPGEHQVDVYLREIIATQYAEWVSRVSIEQTVRIPRDANGVPVPFVLYTPRWLAPSTQTPTHELRYEVVAQLRHWLHKRTARIPVRVFDEVVIAGAPIPLDVPVVGRPLASAPFRAFATASGWRGGDRIRVDAQLGPLLPVVSRKLDDSELVLARGIRDHRSVRIARLGYPSVGLGLRVVPSGLFRADLASGVDAWDRQWRITARSSAQAEPFVRAAVPAILSAKLGDLVRWTDDELVFASGEELGEASLASAARALEQLAVAVRAASATVPALPGIDADAWRAFAAELGGRLAAGDLSVTGKLGGFPVAVTVQWSDRLQPETMHASVGARVTTGEFQAIQLALARPAAGAPPGDVTWPEDIADLRIADGVVSATRAAPVTVERVREPVDCLHRTRLALEPAAGPYR